MLAALKGQKTIGKLLIKKGADVNIQHMIGGTVLMLAACEGHETIVEPLVKA